MIRLELVLLLIVVLCSSVRASDQLSTSNDGSFQAIAQSPRSVALYWRHGGQSAEIYRDGQLLGTYPATAASFASALASGLEPNTQYSFRLGKDGPTIVEKTWCELSHCGEFDVLVIGGTASGVSAAVSAARLGLRVALIEETNRLGGMSSNGLSSTDLRNAARANGFFEDFRLKVTDFYGTGSTGLRYEPRVANAIIKTMVYDHRNISTFMKSTAVTPVMNGRTVVGAIVQDCVSKRTAQIMAKIVIDATDTADFATACGECYRVGREPRSTEEPHAGVIYFDDATQQILPESTGQADGKTQSYAYLMTWRDYGEVGAPLIEKPRFYNPDTYRHSPEWVKTWNYTSGKLLNDKFEINQHPFGIDWPGINYDYPTASTQRRQEIEAMCKDRALGYLYYFQNELGHKNLGLADDEFLDNGNFPVGLYIREARRIEGEHVLYEREVTDARTYHLAGSVGIGDYPMDSHAMEDLKDPNRKDKGEGEMWLAKFTPWYQIPFGVMIPRNVDGLLVTTAVSATHVGYGTLRMEPVRMSLGQSAGAAAYWSILYGIQPRCVHPAWIQDKILSQYSYINWNSDVDRNTRHFKAINFIGARGIFVDEKFEPEALLSRQDALVVLNRLLLAENYPRGLEKSPLPSPTNPVTRGDFAAWLVKAKQKVSNEWGWATPATPSYVDVPKDSPYYAAAETLKCHRISAMLFSEPEVGLFKPDAPMNRADAAEAVYLAHRAFAMNYWAP